MNQRGSGILLHVTSLPSAYGIGDLGPEAYRFVDLLANAGQRYWQILPLNPTCPGFGNSPYQSTSAFAGNTWLISPEQMVADGLLDPGDIRDPPAFPEDRVDYRAIVDHKKGLFGRAFERFRERGPDFHYKEFAARNVSWLDDYAIFVALRERFAGKVWGDWPSDIRDRHQDALRTYGTELADRILEEKFLQYIFDRQWKSLKNHCRSRHIQIIGDLPIYLTYDSVDLWANPGLFKLDGQKKPAFVAGVPPDDFSATGQLWGNPVYDWPALRDRGYDWWIRRVRRSAELYDLFRIDHFRAFADYYEIPAGDGTAERGTWVDGPGPDFFETLARHLPCFSIVAEDLGANTPAVQELLDRFGFPGMKILLFAFGEGLPRSAHIPHNYVPNLICYTGTHDNNTARGWFEEEASEEDKQRFFAYIGQEVPADEVAGELILLAMRSVARISIIPMQDILGLGEEARMNYPSTSEGNWEWRMTPAEFSGAPFARLLRLTELCGRT